MKKILFLFVIFLLAANMVNAVDKRLKTMTKQPHASQADYTGVRCQRLEGLVQDFFKFILVRQKPGSLIIEGQLP